MNNSMQSRKLQQDFDISADYTFPMTLFAPDIAKNACLHFPLQEIASDMGVYNAQAMTLDEVMSHKIQSVNAVFLNMAAYAFSGLDDCDAIRSPISMDLKATPESIQRNGLQVVASNGASYFCANLSVIRSAVEDYSGLLYGSTDEYAKALQKALVAKALRDNKPVMILDCFLKDADKQVLSRCDRYLRDRAVNDNDQERNITYNQPKIELARKG